MVSSTSLAVSKPWPPHSAFDKIVTVLIGPEKVRFEVYKGLLMYYSGYFRGAFGGKFKEGQEGLVHLDEEKIAIFRTVKNWMYSRHLADTLEGETKLDYGALFEVYFFGERRMIPQLMNDTIDVIIRKSTAENTLPAGHISKTYENTPVSSPLRKLLIDMVVHMVHATTFRSWEKSYTKDFLVDVAEEMLNVRSLSIKGWRYLLPSSKYHVAEQPGVYLDPPGPTSKS